MRTKWSTVGWQGILVRTPEDWGLAAVTGDRDKGYIRVDSPAASAVEIRWSAAKSAPDLAAKAREFLDVLRKSGRKKKVKFSGKVEAKRNTPPGTPVRFTWRADRNGYGRLVYCAECSRTIIAQVVVPREENCASFADDILESITDHGEAGWQEWAVFGLRVAVPADLRLEKQTLMSAYIQLAFKGRSGEVVIEQWGLAGSLLRKSSLEEWCRRDALSQVKDFKMEFEPVGDAEHTTIRMTGRRKGVVQRVKTLLRSLTLRPLPRNISGYVWHCPESNRLLSIRAASDHPSLLEGIRQRTRCH